MARVNRGVSTVVGYVLNLGIATILVTGLLVSGGGLVDDQRERTARSQMDVIGNRIAADLETADRLLRTGNGSVTVRSDLPPTVVGSQYQVDVVASNGTAILRVETTRPSVIRTVPVRNVTPVQPVSITGGDLIIDGRNGSLEVTNG
ncbi:DUF7266 family protein [Halodesulfurarchaeum sp.]|uniref:DUF7266 family protein n=1 Tax=Halodesulfurarchaeum sp. TaxID=1980530 RepID=UPI002FC34D34